MRLIDADALIKENVITKFDYSEVVDIEDIIAAPTIDAVSVVHGYWIPPGYPYHWYKSTCSICGYEDKQSGGDKETLAEYHESNYCPHCGARMDGHREEGNV